MHKAKNICVIHEDGAVAESSKLFARFRSENLNVEDQDNLIRPEVFHDNQTQVAQHEASQRYSTYLIRTLTENT